MWATDILSLSEVLSQTYASQFQYTPHGGISQMVMGNSTKETMHYNARLQPLMIELRKTTNNLLLMGLDYTYNTAGQANNGNVHTQTIRAGFLSPTISQSYTYDSLNRLQTASETGSWSQSYSYDRWGNRWVSVSSGYPINSDLTPTQQNHISTTTNRILLAGFDYDTNGNQKAQTRGGQSETLNYDSENRMTSFVSGSTTSYVYDGDGRRVKKVAGTEATVFVYNASGQLIAEYTTGQVQGSGTSYLTTDTLGSTRVVTDASGSVKARHDYLPFGEELGAGIGQRTMAVGYGSMDSTRQRFTSKERDTESGLDYFGARYFSSSQGRFASPDPIFFQKEMPIDPQRFNLYAYVRSNPLKFVDPKGEEIELTGDEEARKKQLEAIRKAVGEQAGAYLYEKQVGTGKKVRYIVGLHGNGPDGKGPGFGSLNRIAGIVGQIIGSRNVVEVHLAKQGDVVKAYEGAFKVGKPGSGGSPGGTLHNSSLTSAKLFILDPAEGYGNYPSYLMSDGSAPALDEGLVIAHEFGHIAYAWELIWTNRTTNEFAVELENSARRLRDPNAALRIRHNKQDTPIETNPWVHPKDYKPN